MGIERLARESGCFALRCTLFFVPQGAREQELEALVDDRGLHYVFCCGRRDDR